MGGVSVGEKDLIREACLQLGMQIVFHGVAMKPGKPVLCATFEKPGGACGLFFGLPGNPVSALMAFERLVRPALLRLMGAADTTPRNLMATLTEDLQKHPGRMEFVRGIASQGAAGLMVVAAGATRFAPSV